MRVLVLAFVPSLLAQGQSDPFRFLPPEPTVVVRVAGPAAWQAQLGTTGLGKALGSPALRKPLQQLQAGLLPELGVDEAMRARLERLQERLLGYGGELVVGVTVDWAALAGHGAPGMVASVALHGDGTTDLAELATQITELLPPGETSALRIGELQVTARAFGRYAFTEPIVHDQALLVWCGHGLADRAERLLERTTPFAPAAELTRGVAGLQVDAGTSWATLRELAGAAAGAAGIPGLELFDLAGAASATRLCYTVFADGGYVGQELVADFTGTTRGVFDVLAPARNRQPKVLRHLPAGNANFSVMSVDLEAAHGLYLQAFALLGDKVPMSRERIEESFTEATKLRLHEDLLALLDGEWLQIDCLPVTAEELAADEEGESKVHVFGLRDGKQAAANVDKALRARGLHAGRKTEDYNGVKVYRMSLLGTVPLLYAFAGDVVVIGMGAEPAERTLRLVLDTVAANARGDAVAPLHAGITTRLQDWGADWCGLSVGNLGEAADMMLAAFGAAAAPDDEDTADAETAQVFAAAIRVLRDELRRNGADLGVNAVWSSLAQWRMRSRW